MKVLEEASYADTMNSRACFELIKKWLTRHLNTIKLIKRQEEALLRGSVIWQEYSQ